MQRFIFTVSAAIVLLAVACKKQTPPEPQGVNFNKLLKTVTRHNSTGSETRIIYTYNSNNRVATAYTETVGGFGLVRAPYTETFYYDAGGRLDSTVTISSISSSSTPYAKLVFRYNGAAQLVNAVNTMPSLIDSSVYTYAAGRVLNRTDYRSDNGLPFAMTLQLDYEFDVIGNPTRLVFKWQGPSPRTDVVLLTYDNRFMPLPVDRSFYPLPANIFLNDETFPNNPVSITTPSGTFSYEYTYIPNNKPLYRKETTTGRFSETVYYYD